MLSDVKRSCLRFGVLALVTAATAASPARAQTRPAGAAPLTPEQLFAHVMHGVVALERNGVPVAVGTVLSGDGRILTALSALAGGEGADVLYADGTVVHAKVGRSDRAVDLALLVPQSLKWTEGLGASGSSPAGEDLRAMLPAPTAGDASGAPKVRLAPAPAIVKGDADAHARDGSGSLLWLDVDTRGAAPVAGAPLLDAAGDVAAILVRACKGPVPPANDDAPGAWSQPSPPSASARAACKPIVVGAPVSAIRAFLSGAPVVSAAAAPGPWLGIRGEREEATVRGVRVVAVAPASPAEKASLKPAVDVIVAVDGHPIDSPEKLADVIAKHAPGDTVKLLVFGADQFREVPVALRPATPSPASRESPAGGASTERGAPGALPPLP
jgi:serine protease Do